MKTQIHNKFKLFAVDFKDNKLSAKSKKEIINFINGEKVLAKSIGVEFLESDSTLIISIGYIEKKNSIKFDLSIKKIGTFSGVDSIPSIEAKMESIAYKIENIICHEFFTTESKEMYSIFLIAE